MKQLKNPFVILAFGLTFLFFVPFPEQYLALKIVAALMVISYGISLGAFKKNSITEEKKKNGDVGKRLQEVEKKLAEMEAREKEQNVH